MQAVYISIYQLTLEVYGLPVYRYHSQKPIVCWLLHYCIFSMVTIVYCGHCVSVIVVGLIASQKVCVPRHVFITHCRQLKYTLSG